MYRFSNRIFSTYTPVPRTTPVARAISPVKAAQLERGAYASLREFIHGVEDAARLDIVKAKRGRRASPGSPEFVFFSQKMVRVQRRASDAAVQWVLNGQEEAWLNVMRSAPKCVE